MKNEILGQPEAPLASPRLKRAAFILASLLSVWLVFFMLFYLKIWVYGKPDDRFPNFEIPPRLSLTFRVVWGYYLICMVAAWFVYFSKLSAPGFRHRLIWIVVFSVLPFLLWLTAILI